MLLKVRKQKTQNTQNDFLKFFFQVSGITYSVVQILRKIVSEGIQQIPNWPVSEFF